MATITFDGAAEQVTGSCFLLDTESVRVLVDCGLFQGTHHSHDANYEPFDFEPSAIDGVIITHAHLDHVGRLPKLFHDGYRGVVYATPATAQLATLVLKDAFDLMCSTAEREQKPMIYQKEDLNRAIKSFKPVPYHTPTNIKSVSFEYFDAGHILGSSSVFVRYGEKSILFSGDLGHYPEPLLPKPQTPPSADLVVMESTYGGVEHNEKQDRLESLRLALDWTLKNNGVLLIPTFAIERTQEILYLFKTLFHKFQYPRIPIYLDSPLAIEALEVFESHCESYDKTVATMCGAHQDPFSFRGLVLTPSVEDSRSINEEPPPKVIMAGSGMMEGGRIQHHLKRYLGRTNTYLLIVGFQAMGTLGRKIAEGEPQVEIFNEPINIKAKVEQIETFSSHADNSALLDWLGGVKDVKKVLICHGELERSEKLKGNIQSRFSGLEAYIPKNKQVVTI